jgi:hypothetical protein
MIRSLLILALSAAFWTIGMTYPARPDMSFPLHPFFLEDIFQSAVDYNGGSDGCTTALISGRVTMDGRPLLWKNRDVHGWDQEFVYDDSGPYAFVGMTYAGVTDQNWGGVNEVGFAIGNANAWNLPDRVPGDDDDGIIIKLALQTCVTVEDFEHIMDSTNSGRTRPAIYEVMDASGGLALFEAADYYYARVDVSDSTEVPEGYAVRANFSYNGSGSNHVGQNRHDRAIELIEDAIDSNALSEKYVIRYVARDLVTPDVDPYPLPWMGNQGNMETGYIEIHDAICRDITTSLFVVQGVLPGEDPLLSTMWVMAGEPSHNIALPLWVHSGRVPQELDGDSTSAICDRVLEIRNTTYDTSASADDILDLWSLVDPRGDGLFPWLFPKEDMIFTMTAQSMAAWRDELPDPDSMALFQDNMASRALLRLNQWAPPKAPTHVVAFAHENALRLQWDPVIEDVFNRPVANVGYKIYGQATPLEGRQIGQLMGTSSANYFDFEFPFPYQVQYVRVTAYTNELDAGNY